MWDHGPDGAIWFFWPPARRLASGPPGLDPGAQGGGLVFHEAHARRWAVSASRDQMTSDLASLQIQRDASPPALGGKKILALLVGVAALCAAAVLGYQKLASRLWKQEIAVAEVALISPAQAQVLVTATGYVVPQSWSKVGAKIPGRLATVLVKEGDTVKAGDVIATLEDADQKSVIAVAQARVQVARAQSATARANLAELEPQVRRARELSAEGAVGRAEFEDLSARREVLQQAIVAADAEARAAQAEVESLRVLLKDRVILSPIDGTVIAKPAMSGETVGPQLTGVANVAEIADFDSIVVETDVPEARLGLIEPGAAAEIVLDAYPTRRYRGTTVDIGKRVNRAKATVVVKVKFTDTLEGVLPDMSARVSFLREALKTETLAEAPKKVVATEAVALRGADKVLFVVEDGKLRAVKVTTGATLGGSLELTDGPPPGTRVVKNPNPDNFDGQRIKEAEQ